MDHPARPHLGEIVGSWPFIHRVLNSIEAVANSRATVLITGESGTGKELVARAVHYRGTRRDKPFRAINCAALPESLFESELFGFDKGAFTGALRDHPGLFEQAHNGTLLLDEISEMSTGMQAKMLRVLQEREVQRLGSLLPSPVDVRVVATTNRNLAVEIDAGSFRKDLFYRLNVVSIHLPPLRDRREDIPLLVEHFIAHHNSQNSRQIVGVSPTALKLLTRYDWPGNVRELENAIARALIVSVGESLGPDDFPSFDGAHSTGETNGIRPGMTVHDTVRKLILVTLAAEAGNQTRAADRLGISTRTLRNKLYEYGIKVPSDPAVSHLLDRARVAVENDKPADTIAVHES